MTLASRQSMWNTTAFTELQYIQSTGTQRISTISANPASGHQSEWYSYIDMEFVALPSGIEKLACGVYFGGLAVRNSNTYRLFFATSSTSTSYKDVSYSSNRMHITLTFTGQSLVFYSVDSDENLATITPAYMLYNNDDPDDPGNKYNLFAGYWSERHAFDYQQVKVYDFKIGPSENDLAMHLRPALDKNGVVCMYDLISKSYVYNEGSGDFIAGPRLVGG